MKVSVNIQNGHQVTETVLISQVIRLHCDKFPVLWYGVNGKIVFVVMRRVKRSSNCGLD